jgi:hypothetical protein
MEVVNLIKEHDMQVWKHHYETLVQLLYTLFKNQTV